jgi:anti-anti-sigma factor
MTQFVAHAPQDGVGSLAVSGEVDIAVVDALLAEARPCLHAATSGLELDLGGLTFVDSSGLAAFVRLRNEAVQAGKTVTLTNVPATTLRLLEVTGLAQAITVRTGD